MTRKVLVDIDNTITYVDYTLRAIENYFEVPRKEVEEIKTFNLASIYGVEESKHQDFWDEREEGIVVNSQLNKKVYEMIDDDLNIGDELYIISARDPHLYDLTEQWLYRNGVSYDKLYCIGKKETKMHWMERMELTFDVVYEDNAEFLSALGDDVYKVAIDYPYNGHVKVDKRITP